MQAASCQRPCRHLALTVRLVLNLRCRRCLRLQTLQSGSGWVRMATNWACMPLYNYERALRHQLCARMPFRDGAT